MQTFLKSGSGRFSFLLGCVLLGGIVLQKQRVEKHVDDCLLRVDVFEYATLIILKDARVLSTLSPEDRANLDSNLFA